MLTSRDLARATRATTTPGELGEIFGRVPARRHMTLGNPKTRRLLAALAQHPNSALSLLVPLATWWGDVLTAGRGSSVFELIQRRADYSALCAAYARELQALEPDTPTPASALFGRPLDVWGDIRRQRDFVKPGSTPHGALHIMAVGQAHVPVLGTPASRLKLILELAQHEDTPARALEILVNLCRGVDFSSVTSGVPRGRLTLSTLISNAPWYGDRVAEALGDDCPPGVPWQWAAVRCGNPLA